MKMPKKMRLEHEIRMYINNGFIKRKRLITCIALAEDWYHSRSRTTDNRIYSVEQGCRLKIQVTHNGYSLILFKKKGTYWNVFELSQYPVTVNYVGRAKTLAGANDLLSIPF